MYSCSMPPFFLSLTVFITGMSVMAVEITASRLLAPYFGASLFVWTNLIGVVLLALSLGYFFGGRLADFKKGENAKKILYPLILITGMLVALIPFAGKPVFLFAYRSIVNQNIGIFLSSLIATFILFTIPLLLLGMVNPLAAKLSLTKMETAGRVFGSLFAFSTIGSIVGTFLPVLVTIPFLGSRETFYLFGGVLILLGIIGMRRMMLVGFLALPLALFLLPLQIHANPRLEYEEESVYNYVRVEKDEAGSHFLLTNEGLGIQSIYHPSRTLTGYYWDAAAAMPVLNPSGKNFLFIGVAGGSSARIVHKFFPYIKLEGVEIDPLMADVAKRFFGFSDIPLKLNIGDGRMFLQNLPEEKRYDFTMVDVYKDELYIPFHLATKEFFELLRSRLTSKGMIMMNIASVSEKSELLHVIANTAAAVFPHVYAWRAPNSYNSVLVAFNERPDFSAVSLEALPFDLRFFLQRIFREIAPVVFMPAAEISTDNHSALEFLTEKMVLQKALD